MLDRPLHFSLGLCFPVWLVIKAIQRDANHQNYLSQGVLLFFPGRVRTESMRVRESCTLRWFRRKTFVLDKEQCSREGRTKLLLSCAFCRCFPWAPCATTRDTTTIQVACASVQRSHTQPRLSTLQ